MNRREFNILQSILVKENYQKNIENQLNFLKNIINEKYYQVENIDKLQQILNKIASNNAFINTKKINKEIKLTFKKKFYNILFEIKIIFE